MPHYANAPIVEAVIDVQMAYAEDPSFDRIEGFAATLSSEFPQKQLIAGVRMVLRSDGIGGVVPNTSASDRPIGFRLTNAEGTRLVQLRRNGFSFSHLQPYTDWVPFATEAMALCRRAFDELRPVSVPRVAVRYINKIAVPAGVNLDEYLNLTPRLLPNVGDSVEGYFLQLVLRQDDLGQNWKAIVNTGLEASQEPGEMLVVLDVDLFCEDETKVDIGAVGEVLAKLRDRKNEIFEAAITDKVRSIIQ